MKKVNKDYREKFRKNKGLTQYQDFFKNSNYTL